MQLVAYGAQDIYLTGNPQITFFKVIYRRHTNFSCESIDQTFNGQSDFGRKVTCTISRNGDLIHRMYLKVELDSVTLKGQASKNVGFRWVDWLGHALIKNVEIEIGGQRIDKHYGEWLQIWNELTQTAGHALGYAAMVGNVPDLTTLRQINNDDADTFKVEGKTLYIPLQFWFNRHPGLALPLIALQYHEVKINVEFRDVEDCFFAGYDDGLNGWKFDASVLDKKPSMKNASLYVDYIYLDTDERRRFAQSSHEYLIQQLQFTGDESVGGSSSQKIKLSLNHPCSELVWVVLRDSHTDHQPSLTVENVTTPATTPGKQWFNWSHSPEFDTVASSFPAVGPAGGNAKGATSAFVGEGQNPVVSAKIQLNGHDRFSERDGSYFNLVQPYQHHENVPSAGVNVYSFALKPEEHQPSGTCNMSRIDNATLVLNLQPNLGASKVKVFAINYNVLRIMSGMGGLAYSN